MKQKLKTNDMKYFNVKDIDNFLDKMKNSPKGKIDLTEKEMAIANYFLVKELDNQTYESGVKCAKEGRRFKFQTDTEGGTVASDEFQRGYSDGLKLKNNSTNL